MLAVRSSEFTLTLMCIMLFLSHADAPTFLLRHNCTLPWNLQLNLPYIYTYNIFFFIYIYIISLQTALCGSRELYALIYSRFAV